MRKHLSSTYLAGLLVATGLIASLPSANALALPELPRVDVPVTELKEQATRIAERKVAESVTLTEETINKVGSACENAQVKLGAISTRATELKRRRETIYGDLVDQIGKIDTKLSAQRVPHDDLHESVGRLTTKWTTLEGSMVEYTTALDDAREVDCVSDPSGFYASLASARKGQIKVLEQNDDFLSELKTIKQQLTKIKTLVSEDLPVISLKEDDKVARN